MALTVTSSATAKEGLMMRIERLLFLLVAFVASFSAWPQSYPVKPIRIYSTEVGGSLDLAARILAQGLSTGLGQAVVVINRPGAGGVIAVEALKKEAPDGYSLGFYASSLWLTPLMQAAPYDLKDFAPIVLAVSSPNVLVVHPSLPVNSVNELIALLKSKPGQLSYGASGTGSGPHLASELFKYMAGVEAVRIPYKGGAQTVADLVSGRLQFAFTTPGTIIAQVKAGKVRPIGVTSLRPSVLAPDLPAVADAIPFYQSATMQGLHAPARVPRSIITRLNQESVKFLYRQETRERFIAAGTEVAGGTPEEFEAIINAEVARLGPVIKAAGIAGE